MRNEGIKKVVHNGKDLKGQAETEPKMPMRARDLDVSLDAHPLSLISVSASSFSQKRTLATLVHSICPSLLRMKL